MILSGIIGNFSKSDADTLRKAMGKKQKDVLDKMKSKFIDGANKNGFDLKVCEKIWGDWEKFAEYAFNKSHSTCYAYLAYQTAYLKAHYPAEFLAANLSRNLDDIKEITKLMDTCRRSEIKVLGPDINESFIKFNVNKEGNLRFGLGAIKGLGESAAELIISERNSNGNYKNIFDLVERINLTTINKRSLEALAFSGALDSFKLDRSKYFAGENITFIEQLLRYGTKYQSDKNNSQQSLFGDSASVSIKQPDIPETTEEWTSLYKLGKEKELIGIYLSAHPLDPYKLEITHFTTNSLSDLSNLTPLENKTISVAGFVTNSTKKTSQKGNIFGNYTIEDFTNSFKFNLFGKDHVNFDKFLQPGYCLFIKATVKRRQFKENENSDLEFKILSIQLLSEMRKNIDKVVVKINFKNINESLVAEIEKMCKKHKGRSKIIFNIYSEEDNISLEMFSRNYLIVPNDDVINFLNENDCLFSLN